MPFMKMLSAPRRNFESFDESIEEAITLYRTVLQYIKKKREITEIVRFFNEGKLRKVKVEIKDFKHSTEFLLEQAPKALVGKRAEETLLKTMLQLIRDQREDWEPVRRANHHLVPANFDRLKKNNTLRWDIDGLAGQLNELAKIWQKQLKIIDETEWEGDLVKDIIQNHALKTSLEDENVRYRLLNEHLTKLVRHIRYLTSIEDEKYSTVIKAENNVLAAVNAHSDIIRHALGIKPIAAVTDLILMSINVRQEHNIDVIMRKTTDINDLDGLVFLVILASIGSDETYKLIGRNERKGRSIIKNYALMESAGIPISKVLAYDEERAVIMEEFVDGPTLAEFVKHIASYEHSTCVSIFNALGSWVGRMHRKGAVHGDLFARNVKIRIENGKILGLVFIDLEDAEKSDDDKDFESDLTQLVNTCKLDHLPEYKQILKEAYAQEMGEREYVRKVFQ